MYLYEPEYPPYPKDPDHPEERGRHRKVRHHVLHDDADDAGDDEDEVEDVPAGGEVHEAEADDLDAALQGEDCREERVADLEGEGDDPRLVVVLDAHAHHVQENQHEDGDLEPANSKKHYGTSNLQGRTKPR